MGKTLFQMADEIAEDDQHEEVLELGACASGLDVQFVDGHSVEEPAHDRACCTPVICPPFFAMSADRPIVCGCCTIPIQRSGKEVDKSAKCRFSA